MPIISVRPVSLYGGVIARFFLHFNFFFDLIQNQMTLITLIEEKMDDVCAQNAPDSVKRKNSPKMLQCMQMALLLWLFVGNVCVFSISQFIEVGTQTQLCTS